MSLAEFMDWQHFDQQSPLPDRRMDVHFAVQTSSLMNAWARRQDGKAFTAADFMLFETKPDEPPRADVGTRILGAFRTQIGTAKEAP